MRSAKSLDAVGSVEVEPERHAAAIIEAVREKRPFSIKRQGERQPSLFGQTFNEEGLAQNSGILDHPLAALAALAALLGILIAFQRGPSQGERNQEANYDLTKYRPAPREW
jgi:hypothetical protein